MIRIYIIAACVVAIVAALVFGARHFQGKGRAQCAAEFHEADKKGAENARETADRFLRDFGRIDDLDGLLRETNGLRD